jgi:hypothetical protein
MVGLEEGAMRKKMGGKDTVYMTESQNRLSLGSVNACRETQKSHGKKMVSLESENVTSQLMVSLLCIFRALYPPQINSFMQ